MPVINPWLIYLIETLDTIKTATGIFIFVFIIGIFPLFSSTLIEEINLDRKKLKKWMTIAVISLMVMIVARIIIPSKETCYKMLIAQNITYERVDKAEETIEKIYNDVKKALAKEEN